MSQSYQDPQLMMAASKAHTKNVFCQACQTTVVSQPRWEVTTCQWYYPMFLCCEGNWTFRHVCTNCSASLFVKKGECNCVGEIMCCGCCPPETHEVGKWTRGCAFKTHSASVKPCCYAHCKYCESCCRPWTVGNDFWGNCCAD